MPAGIVLLLLCGALFAGLMSNRANQYQPAALYVGAMVVVILGWSVIELALRALQAVMG